MKERGFCFIILNYCQSDLVIRDVRSISNLYPATYIVIVDNDSKDGSFERIREQLVDLDNIRIYKNDQNTGYASGNNFGIRKAIEEFNPEFIGIMNPDVSFYEPNMVDLLVDSFACDSKLAICTGFMLNSKRELSCAGLSWSIPDRFDDCLLNLPVVGNLFISRRKEKLVINENGIAYVEVVPGSFFVARTKAFVDIGFFDENTFLYCEERIIALKAKKKGFRTALNSKTFFIHNHSYTTKSYRATMKSYTELLKSRLYYNFAYNSWPRGFVLPAFFLSAGLGYILSSLSWILKKLFQVIRCNI